MTSNKNQPQLGERFAVENGIVAEVSRFCVDSTERSVTFHRDGQTLIDNRNGVAVRYPISSAWRKSEQFSDVSAFQSYEWKTV